MGVTGEHAYHRRACIIGVKAIQNVRAAVNGLAKIGAMYGPRDPVVVSSLFQTAVIRYGRPFTDTKIEGSTARYPLKRIKQADGFSASMHDHLLDIRNTLIAHDDFDQITPRVLIVGMQVERGPFIPAAVGLSNKALAFPASTATISAMRDHCAATLRAMSDRLAIDAGHLRAAYLRGPDPDPPKFTHHYGSTEVGAAPTQVIPPDFMGNSWLNPNAPDFTSIHAGFQYETMKWRQDFFGPEEIDLGNGNTMRIEPTTKPSDGKG